MPAVPVHGSAYFPWSLANSWVPACFLSLWPPLSAPAAKIRPLLFTCLHSLNLLIFVIVSSRISPDWGVRLGKLLLGHCSRQIVLMWFRKGELMELHERARSEVPAVGPGGLPVPERYHCATSADTGRHFHHHKEASQPALLSLTQHCGAADSVLQPLDGYLLLFITVSAPREHQSQFLLFVLLSSQPAAAWDDRICVSGRSLDDSNSHFYFTHTREHCGNHFITSKSRSNPSLGPYNISCFEHCCDYTVHNRADQHRPTWHSTYSRFKKIPQLCAWHNTPDIQYSVSLRAGLISLKTTATLMKAAIYNVWKQSTLAGVAPKACGDTVFSMPLQENHLWPPDCD